MITITIEVRRAKEVLRGMFDKHINNVTYYDYALSVMKSALKASCKSGLEYAKEIKIWKVLYSNRIAKFA